MSKLWKKSGLVVLAAGLFFGLALSARADDGAVKNNNNLTMGEGHGWDKGGWEDTCNTQCDLTNDQKSKLKAIFKKQRAATQPLADQIKVDMAILRQKLDAKASDDNIKAILVNLDSEKDKLATLRDGFEDQLDALLTPTQEGKFLLHKDECAKCGGKGDGKQAGVLTHGDDSSENTAPNISK
jgi:Spy/CpxP family protein refolding chaperone